MSCSLHPLLIFIIIMNFCQVKICSDSEIYDLLFDAWGRWGAVCMCMLMYILSQSLNG